MKIDTERYVCLSTLRTIYTQCGPGKHLSYNITGHFLMSVGHRKYADMILQSDEKS